MGPSLIKRITTTLKLLRGPWWQVRTFGSFGIWGQKFSNMARSPWNLAWRTGAGPQWVSLHLCRKARSPSPCQVLRLIV